MVTALEPAALQIRHHRAPQSRSIACSEPTPLGDCVGFFKTRERERESKTGMNGCVVHVTNDQTEPPGAGPRVNRSITVGRGAAPLGKDPELPGYASTEDCEAAAFCCQHPPSECCSCAILCTAKIKSHVRVCSVLNVRCRDEATHASIHTNDKWIAIRVRRSAAQSGSPPF